MTVMTRAEMTPDIYEKFLESFAERWSAICKRYIETHPEEAPHILKEIEKIGTVIYDE